MQSFQSRDESSSVRLVVMQPAAISDYFYTRAQIIQDVEKKKEAEIAGLRKELKEKLKKCKDEQEKEQVKLQ